MTLSKNENELFEKILDSKGITKRKWEQETLAKKKVEFLTGFTNPKSDIKKEWDKETLDKARRELLSQELLNMLNNSSNQQ